MVSFKKAAFEVLKRANEPLTTKEITDIALQEGMIRTEGQTPEATMGAQLYVDINTNENSPFTKVGRGRFSLKTLKDSVSSSLILIEKQNDNVKNALREKLNEIDPYQFEYLIGDLLQKIGYENVTVTKRTGDGGIDIIADLTVGGLTNVNSVIQVKRHKQNISGDVVTQLRGSAKVDQRGLVITTSDFTKNAIEEAKALYKMPVSLVNGEKLIDLLFKYEVGVKKEEKVIYSLDNDYFQSETTTFKRSPVTDKNRSIWPLPGGIYTFVETLNKFLSAVEIGINTKTKLVKWFKDSFEKVQSEKTAMGYIFVPKSMGLVDIENGKYFITEDGKHYMKTKDLDVLYNIISKNIFAFDEIIEFLRTSKKPKDEQEILKYLKNNLDVEWTTYAQTTFRLLWLVNLKKIRKLEDGYMVN